MTHSLLSILLSIPFLPSLAEGAVGVNPPGWLGGLLALLALVLPTGVFFWLKNRAAVPEPNAVSDDE